MIFPQKKEFRKCKIMLNKPTPTYQNHDYYPLKLSYKSKPLTNPVQCMPVKSNATNKSTIFHSEIRVVFLAVLRLLPNIPLLLKK